MLDCFSYSGGFALQLAPRAIEVTALDISEEATALLAQNASRNHLPNVSVRTTNVFDELRALERVGERYDTIVLDPPAFAKTAPRMATPTVAPTMRATLMSALAVPDRAAATAPTADPINGPVANPMPRPVNIKPASDGARDEKPEPILLAIAAVTLSTMHQSSLGSLFLLMPDKLAAQWWSPAC